VKLATGAPPDDAGFTTTLPENVADPALLVAVVVTVSVTDVVPVLVNACETDVAVSDVDVPSPKFHAIVGVGFPLTVATKFTLAPEVIVELAGVKVIVGFVVTGVVLMTNV
jgi:hypothetical protein